MATLSGRDTHSPVHMEPQGVQLLQAAGNHYACRATRWRRGSCQRPAKRDVAPGSGMAVACTFLQCHSPQGMHTPQPMIRSQRCACSSNGRAERGQTDGPPSRHGTAQPARRQSSTSAMLGVLPAALTGPARTVSPVPCAGQFVWKPTQPAQTPAAACQALRLKLAYRPHGPLPLLLPPPSHASGMRTQHAHRHHGADGDAVGLGVLPKSTGGEVDVDLAILLVLSAGKELGCKCHRLFQ